VGVLSEVDMVKGVLDETENEKLMTRPWGHTPSRGKREGR